MSNRAWTTEELSSLQAHLNTVAARVVVDAADWEPSRSGAASTSTYVQPPAARPPRPYRRITLSLVALAFVLLLAWSLTSGTPPFFSSGTQVGLAEKGRSPAVVRGEDAIAVAHAEAQAKREREERLAAEKRALAAEKTAAELEQRAQAEKIARARAEAQARRHQEERVAAERKLKEAMKKANDEKEVRERADAEIDRQRKQRLEAERMAAQIVADRAKALRTISIWIEHDFLNDNIAYAEMVDWYDQGIISRDAVLKDRARYLARWPERKFTLVPGSIQISEISPDRYQATFEHTYVVRSAPRNAQTSGTSRITLDLEMIDARPHVARQRETTYR